MSASDSKIACNLKRLQDKKVYSLEKVVRLSDLSLNTTLKIENRANKNPTIETLIKIAKAMKVE
jgi:transcriptional regulator with XRE-family HTH domain